MSSGLLCGIIKIALSYGDGSVDKAFATQDQRNWVQIPRVDINLDTVAYIFLIPGLPKQDGR